MKDEKTIRTRLEQLRGQLLQWGTPDLMVFTTIKDELRGWIRALEWVLGKDLPKDPRERLAPQTGGPYIPGKRVLLSRFLPWKRRSEFRTEDSASFRSLSLHARLS